MLRRIIYLFILICLLASLTSPAKATPPTPTPEPDQQSQAGAPKALEATLGKGIDPEQFPPAAPLVIDFSEAMDSSSAQPALLTFPYLPGEESWDKDAMVLTYQPEDGFPNGKEVQVFLNSDLRSKRGEAFEAAPHWTLKVQGAPRIIAHDPVNPLLGLRQPTLTVEFDREMTPDSLQTAIWLEPAVSYTLKTNGNKVDIAITQPLEPGMLLKLSVTTDAQDPSGAALDRPYSWSYRVMPFELSDLVCSKKRIAFHLSYSIQPGSIQQNITIDPPLTGKWSDGVGNLDFVFEPDEELDWAKRYTIQFNEPLKDIHGQPLPAIEPVTCTVDPPFTALPMQKGEEGFYDYIEKIEVTFQTAMDDDSVKQAFSIQPDVPGELSYISRGENGGVLTFNPERGFGPGDYSVTLSPSMRTADNAPILLDAYQWQFTLQQFWGYNSGTVFTDHGSNIQVVDADAPRYLQFAGREDQQRLYFDAYPVDLPQFVQLYRESFGDVNSYWGSVRKINTEGLERSQSFSFTAKTGVNDLLLPSDLPNGLYVLDMRSESGLLDQIFLVLSRNTITAKLSGTRLFTWTTNINGEVILDAEMRLYTQTGELMREGKTDDQGIYETTTPIESTPMLVAARDEEGDITVAGLTGAWRTSRSYDYWYSYWYDSYTYKNPSRLMAYIFTDRPIYRPGNTVHYKAILRRDNDMLYTLLGSDQSVTVRLRDARGNLLEEREQYPNDFGTINGDFILSPDGNLGSYHIEVEALGDTIPQSFSVEEYHKPDYSVSIQPSRKEFVKGESVELTVEARYFLGQPVANADVTLKFFHYWDPPTIIKGKTGLDGRYVFQAGANIIDAMPWYSFELSSNWGSSLKSAVQAVEATVSDGSNQPVSSATTYRVYSAAEGIELDTHGYFKSPGQPFFVDVKAATYDGKPVANRKISLVVYGSVDYGWDKEISRVETVTGADGKAAIEVKLETAGDYKIAVISKDSSGEALYNSDWVTAYKPGQAWDFGGRDEVSIHADKEAYQPYGRAKLMVRSTFSGSALLTFERGSVIHYQMVNLTAPITEIETEVIPEYAPNVYVTINAWQDVPYKPHENQEEDYYYLASNRPNSKLRIDSVELKVDATEKELKVTVTSDKTTFAPREKAEFTIQVSEAAQAELAVGLVDEAIYSLKNEPWQAIYPAFYNPRPHSVATYDSMAILRYMIEEGGRGGGGDPSPNLESPRSEFPDTAIWLPAVVTDGQGKAVVTLTLPDTLTRWRLTVRAVTRGTRVGQTTYTIQTQQAVALRPAFPSVVTEGDQFVLAAYIHNTGETTQTLTAELSAPGLMVIDGDKQTMEVKPGQSIPLNWQVRAENPGTVQVTLRAVGTGGVDTAQGKGLGDAIRLPITVQPRATLNMDQRSGQFSGTLDLPVFLPPTALDSSGVRLELSRSLAGDALSGLESLIGYPYGCVEQTMSKALPNAVVGRALKRLGLSKPELEQKLPGLIDAGVKKLYGMQHYDGGWGWWTDDVTDAYQTAWVVFGLSMTRDAGYPVDPQVIHRGARALKAMLNLSVPYEENEKDWSNGTSESDLDSKLKAFMLYSLALAGEGDDKLALELYQNYASLDAFSQSALALALHELGREQEAREIVGELESTAYRADSEAYWTGSTEDGIYHQKTMSSEVRTAALALHAIQTIHPESSLTGEIVRYLMGRKQVSGWGTTNETAFTLLALTGQLETAKDTTGPTSYRVLVNGQEVLQANWKSEDLTAVVELPRETLATGLNRLEVIPDSDTPLYYSLGIRLSEDAAQAQPAGNMIVKREYLDSKGMKGLTAFQPGQVVMVRLTVTTRDSLTPYVMVEDHLPGGLEALNEGLNTTSREFNEQSLYYFDNSYYSDEFQFNPFTWEQWGYNNKEIHDGRVTFFITSMESKSITLSYYTRALRSGTFTALPAEASAMYNPDLWGHSETAVVEIQ